MSNRRGMTNDELRITNSNAPIRRSQLVIRNLLVGLIALLVADQTRFLFTYPVPDTGMWFGDESWTMLTARALAHSGVARVPEALGSSLAQSNGFVNGSIWITGLLYGIPANLFASLASPVAIGRVVSLILSLGIVYSIAVWSRVRKQEGLPGLLAAFALITSDAFAFSSHSARFDAATGLAVLLFVLMLIWLFKRSQKETLFTGWYFAIAFLAVLSLAVSVHVPTLIALPAFYAIVRLGVLKNLRRITAAALGLVAGCALLAILYWSTTGSLDLLGKGYNQYYNVANSLPILHPYSWQVQRINTIDRAVQVWNVAWPLVLALMAGIIAWFVQRTHFGAIVRFALVLSLLVLGSWMLFEGPAVFYNIHILPVVALSASILLRPVLASVSARWLAVAAAIVIAATALLRQEQYGHVGARLVNGNRAAIHSLVDPIARDSRPLILTDEPGLNEIAADTNVRLMTNHLLLFGAEDKPVPDILREQGVHFLLLYSTVRWHSPFRGIADSLYTLVGERTGTLTDQARTYSDPAWNEIDTLRLYKAK